MLYYSTSHLSPKVGFKEAIAKSEADDGGLYLPENLPVLPDAFLNNTAGMSLKDISFVINCIFAGDDMSSLALKRICDEVYTMKMPLYELEPGIYVMEMFHGPTMTVKDLGAAFLTRIMKYLYENSSASHSVMIATNGYSGAAIAKGFHDVGGTEVFVLYPQGTFRSHLGLINSLGDNIHAIEVKGTIDNCKEIIAKAFEDKEIVKNLTLTSANSTNIGFLLSYVSVFFYAYSQLLNRTNLSNGLLMSIPAGNCGNLLAAYIAKKMGLPVTKIIAACNFNAGFNKFLHNGVNTKNAESFRTYAYGMDTPYPGNLPRFVDLCRGKTASLRKDIVSSISTDKEIADTINDVYERHGYLLDPHSAIAYNCLKKNASDGVPGIVFATAHPSRSAEILNLIDRGNLKLPFILEKTYCCRPEALIPPSYAALKKYLRFFVTSNAVQNRG